MKGGRAAVVVLGAAAAAMLLVMVAPAAVQRMQDRMDHTARYPSGAAAKADRGGQAPGWLPDSATGVALLGSDRQGDRLIRATLPERALPAACTAGGRSAASACGRPGSRPTPRSGPPRTAACTTSRWSATSSTAGRTPPWSPPTAAPAAPPTAAPARWTERPAFPRAGGWDRTVRVPRHP
ncbi:hypothetical protein ACFQ2M_33705 [Kitasatospora saccharophila]|uniref:hypothetical protein n=1 Tax=Kitasatospora saccharophila TaxID=407973 RepID=UPI0036370E70